MAKKKKQTPDEKQVKNNGYYEETFNDDQEIPDNGTGFLFDFDDDVVETKPQAEPAKTETPQTVSEPAVTDQTADKPIDLAVVKALEPIQTTDETDEQISVEVIQETVEPIEEKTLEVVLEAEEPIPEPLAAPDPTDVVEEALVAEDKSGDRLTLAYFASRAYLEYAISVVKGRALPEVADGLKPVQRRILYDMKRLGLSPDLKHVKSARIVGDVLGKYHPHGDMAAYDAMVRMAQDFNLRYPLVDGQGNFGSADGDGAAHMRYTEARLSRYADLLLSELDQGSTVFVPNYDGAFKEPVLLPARLPFLLLNGSSGIAVGMATEIPPHNMREVAKAAILMIQNPQVTLDELLAVMPGPDLPGGAQVISSPRDIRSAYETGYGSLQMRATYHFEELARGQWQLIVTELPYKIGAQKVLSEIDSITNPKPPVGKKVLTPKQQQEKALMLGVLDSVRDESDKNNPVRLVFEPKSKAINRDEFVNTLFTKTSLEAGCKFNIVAIGIDGRPRQKGLVEVLSEWVTFRLKTVTARLQTSLKDVMARISILEGRYAVTIDIDRIIQIIREADDPKQELMTRYGLTDQQAEDILELKLRQLAGLDAIKLQKDIAKLKKEEERINRILNDDKKLRAFVVDEITADAEKYGDNRRTKIEEAQVSAIVQKIPDEAVTVVISEKGFVRCRTGHGIDAAAMSFKLGDSLGASFECRTVDPLIVLSSSGRVFTVPVSQLPNARGDGTHISAFIQLPAGDSVVSYCAGSVKTKVLLASDDGAGFVCTLGDMVVRQKAGKVFFNLSEGAKPLPIRVCTPTLCWIAVLTKNGRMLVFETAELRALSSGGKGVALIVPEAGDKVVAALPISPSGVIVCGLGRGNKPQELNIGPRLIVDYRSKRARKGKRIDARWNFTQLLPSKIDSTRVVEDGEADKLSQVLNAEDQSLDLQTPEDSDGEEGSLL